MIFFPGRIPIPEEEILSQKRNTCCFASCYILIFIARQAEETLSTSSPIANVPTLSVTRAPCGSLRERILSVITRTLQSHWVQGYRTIQLTCRGYVPAVIILLLLLIVNASTPAAQSHFPIVVSGGAHALTVPWYPGLLTKRLNPALSIGTERTLKQGEHSRLYQTANLGYFRHYWWMTGIYINTELGASRSLPLGFHGDIKLGIGYLHYFWRRKSLELKDGRYVQATDWGRPSVMIPLSIVLGYHGNSTSPSAVAPFISAQWAVQTPFTNEAPAMTHFILYVGFRINRRIIPQLWRR